MTQEYMIIPGFKVGYSYYRIHYHPAAPPTLINRKLETLNIIFVTKQILLYSCQSIVAYTKNKLLLITRAEL